MRSIWFLATVNLLTCVANSAAIAATMPGKGKKKRTKAAVTAVDAAPMTEQVEFMIAAKIAAGQDQKSFSWQPVASGSRWRIKYRQYE